LSWRWFDRALKPSVRSPPPGSLGGMRLLPIMPVASRISPQSLGPLPPPPNHKGERFGFLLLPAVAPPPQESLRRGGCAGLPVDTTIHAATAAALQRARCGPRLSTINGVEVGLPELRDGGAAEATTGACGPPKLRHRPTNTFPVRLRASPGRHTAPHAGAARKR
jgi:hypothetical protein